MFGTVYIYAIKNGLSRPEPPDLEDMPDLEEMPEMPDLEEMPEMPDLECIDQTNENTAQGHT